MQNRKPGHYYVLMTCLPRAEGEFVELEDHEGKGVGAAWKPEGDLFVLEIPIAGEATRHAGLAREVTIHKGDELRVTLGDDGFIESVEAGPARETDQPASRTCCMCGDEIDIHRVYCTSGCGFDISYFCERCFGRRKAATDALQGADTLNAMSDEEFSAHMTALPPDDRTILLTRLSKSLPAQERDRLVGELESLLGTGGEAP